MNQNSSRITELTPGLLRETDTENILKDWSSNFEVCFPISAAELKKRIFDRPDRCPEASLCVRDAEGKVQGCIVTKISDQQELYPDTAWITLLYVNPAYRKKGYGRLLYQQAQEVMSKKNVHTILIGQDFYNLFSGIPSPGSENIDFFFREGFILNDCEHYDLEADITDNRKISAFDPGSFEQEFRTETLAAEDDMKMLEFLRNEETLPDRWAFEMQEYLDQKKDRNCLMVMKRRTDGSICGFCMLQVNEEGRGGLGPIGIAKAVRGRHVGDYLLYQSLCQLKKIGGQRICIDWTILKDFYGQFGFRPVRIFRGGYKEI
jgi:GNAT superfamily N-acetyltransferase